MASPLEFYIQALFAAVDARRRDEKLHWPALATPIWEQSRVLNARRTDHPISPATIRKLAEGGGLSCQPALFVLRWLEVPPETFVAVPQPGTAGVPLPLADEAHRLRWNLRKLYGALNRTRRSECHLAASGRSPALHIESIHRPTHRQICDRRTTDDED